jgi:hypothetical protein
MLRHVISALVSGSALEGDAAAALTKDMGAEASNDRAKLASCLAYLRDRVSSYALHTLSGAICACFSHKCCTVLLALNMSFSFPGWCTARHVISGRDAATCSSELGDRCPVYVIVGVSSAAMMGAHILNSGALV